MNFCLGEPDKDDAFHARHCTVFTRISVDCKLVDWKVFDNDLFLGLLKTNVSQWDSLGAGLVALAIALLLRSLCFSKLLCLFCFFLELFLLLGLVGFKLLGCHFLNVWLWLWNLGNYGLALERNAEMLENPW